ncbi:MAG: trypsin-like serine protease [Myxococcota bacterium]|nr:trypsin-like serine protease [Myxococcota bacterium]
MSNAIFPKRTPVLVLSAAFLAGTVGACEDIETEPIHGSLASANVSGIVNGTPTNYESWKGVVGLLYDPLGILCTGTLIDPEVILTTASCVYVPDWDLDAVHYPSRMQVLGGAEILGDSSVSYPAPSEIVTHSSWTGAFGSQEVDLAMIQLSSPITTVETYGVRANPSAQVGDTGKIVGYGLSSSSDPLSAGVHRVGDTSILSLSQGLIEIGNPSANCDGDGGGPFFTQQESVWVVTGVHSFGVSPTCSATEGSYEVNVLTYRAWIDETMKTLVGHGLDETDSDTQGTDTDDTETEDTDTTSIAASDPCAGEVRWACNPVASTTGCSGTEDACDYGETQDGGEGFYCFPESTLPIGSECNDQDGPRCVAGATCIDSVCRAYCCPATNCGSGMECQQPSPYWSKVSPQHLGVCQPSLSGGEEEGEDDTGTNCACSIAGFESNRGLMSVLFTLL